MAQNMRLLWVVLLLAGCDGNPFVEDGAQPDSADGKIYGEDLGQQDIVMNSLIYDPVTQTLVINNIPFDGATGENGEAEYARIDALPNGFEVYDNVAGRSYFAVFRRSDSGYSQVGAVGTETYIQYGFGGLTAQRLNAAVSMPRGEYVYSGEYAAIRTYDEAQPNSPNQVQYVTGDVTMDVDVSDFDVTGAVEGIISNRILYDENRNPIGALDDYISLATAEIDFETDTISSSAAFGVSFSDRANLTSGNWAAVFAGPNGEEIAGIVLLEGAAGDGADPGAVRESGVFIALR